MWFVLFPMVHLATPAFHEEVASRLRACQLVVAEGVSGRSASGWALTLAYRLMGRARRHGLVVQDLALKRLVVEERDAMLVRALAAIREERCSEPIDVAVLYGAGHMPAVARVLLARFGYQARSAEWPTVFDS